MYKSEVLHPSGIYAKVVEDSIANGIRLTTMEIRFHRFILPEFNTHRMFSRNFSSSRAIPVNKMLEQVENDPAMPVHWGKNQPGMQAKEELEGSDKWGAIDEWTYAAQSAAINSSNLSAIGVHKQIANRVIEPFQFVKGVVTATEWDNFFALRDHEAAQPEIQVLAQCMKQAMDESEPKELEVGQYHLPYLKREMNLDWDFDFLTKEDAVKVSAARCARVSYMNHDNTSPSVENDIELYNQLVIRPYTDKRGFSYGGNDPIHASPTEHVAFPMLVTNATNNGTSDSYLNPHDWYKGVSHMDGQANFWSGNLRGWIQYRKLIGG